MSGRLKVSGPFFEKTGRPLADNAARRMNRSIQRDTPKRFRINAKGRKRVRKLFHIEADNYQHLTAHVMNQLILERASASTTPESAE